VYEFELSSKMIKNFSLNKRFTKKNYSYKLKRFKKLVMLQMNKVKKNKNKLLTTSIRLYI